MSHFTRCDKANIVDKNAFVAACKELGLTDIRENTTVKDYYGKSEKVDVAARAPGARYDISLKKNAKGQFDMIADFWGVRGERRLYPELEKQKALGTDADLQGKILQVTSKHTIIAQYRRQGFVARVSTDEKNNIRVSLTR